MFPVKKSPMLCRPKSRKPVQCPYGCCGEVFVTKGTRRQVKRRERQLFKREMWNQSDLEEDALLAELADFYDWI